MHGGTSAAEGNTTNGDTYAKKTLPATYTDAYARVWFDVLAGPDQVNLLRLRDAGRQLDRLRLRRDHRTARVPQRRDGHEHAEQHRPGPRLARARAPHR